MKKKTRSIVEFGINNKNVLNLPDFQKDKRITYAKLCILIDKSFLFQQLRGLGSYNRPLAS